MRNVILCVIAIHMSFACGERPKGAADWTVAVDSVAEDAKDEKVLVTLQGPENLRVSARLDDKALRAAIKHKGTTTTLTISGTELAPGKNRISLTASTAHPKKSVTLDVEVTFTPKIRFVDRRFDCPAFNITGKLAEDGTLSVEGLQGTRVRFGTLERLLEGGKTETLVPDLLPRLTTTPLSEILSPDRYAGPFTMPLTITSAQQVSASLDLPLYAAQELKGGLSAFFSGVTKGAVLFPDEAATGGNRTLYDVQTAKLFGTAAKASEIDLVAVTEEKKSQRDCGTYKNSKGETTTYNAAQIDFQITVFERRTGKKTAQKEFRGWMPECPKSMKSLDNQTGTPERKPIETWMESLVAK
ncbi:hypothetical protein KKC22_03195 [Myxococcota bacterium]|nr:hypothetical protein [Myxococcota bacterium]